jgi:hypothetical protein
MLTAQTLLLLLKRWARNELDSESTPQKLMNQDIPRTLLGTLAQTMSSQKDDGSWESKCEVTAYAILTLAALLSLPWVDFLKSEGIACMLRGKAYLEKHRQQWRIAERLWVEKTVYGSLNLSQAYCLAASKVGVPPSLISEKISEILSPTLTKKMSKLAGFFSRVPPFSSGPMWKLQLSLLQCGTYTAALKDHRYDIFPPTESGSDEKYQDYIPFTWIGCNDVLSAPVKPQTLWEMMQLSMFNFQIDAYMETVVRSRYNGRLGEVKAMIVSLFHDHLKQGTRINGGESYSANPPTTQTGSEDLRKGAPNGTEKSVPKNGTTNGNGMTGGKDAPNGSITAGTTDGGGVTNGDHIRNGDHIMNGDHKSTVDLVIDGNRFKNGNGTHTSREQVEGQDQTVKTVLTKFIRFSMQHPKILASPIPIQKWLAHELQAFLLAHVTHMEDCDGLARSVS